VKQFSNFLNSKYVIYITPLLYLGVAIFSLNKIGIGWDTPVNLNKGEQVFNFLTTFNKNYLLDSTYIGHSFRYFSEIPSTENGHPPAFSFISYTLGHFLSSVFGFRYYFFHLANVFLTAIGLIYIAKIIIKWGSPAKLYLVPIVQLILISIPAFFVFSIVSTKDTPVVFLTLISIYFLSTITAKNYVKNILISFILFIIALFSKLTAIFITPFVLYLIFKNRKFVFTKKMLSLLFVTFLVCVLVFWPNILLNTQYEFSRLSFVYLHLPKVSVNEYAFTHFYLRKLPVVYSAIFASSVLFLPFIKKRTYFSFWIFPTVLYLIVVNRYYQVLRQFLFIFPILVILFYFVVDFLQDRYVFLKKYSGLYLIPLILFALYLILLPVPKKVFYTSYFAKDSSKDVWGVGLPVALNYVYKNYQPTKIYYSPLAFLMEYEGVYNKGFEIVYTPTDSVVWIATTDVAAYGEEKKVREQYYTKDDNFLKGAGSIEVWVRKPK